MLVLVYSNEGDLTMEAICKAADDLCIALHAEVMRCSDVDHERMLELSKQHDAATRIYMVCFKLWLLFE